jgi:6-phosphogluconolactonase
MTHIQHIEVLPDADAVARRGAEVMVEHARVAIAERGEFTLALSGGRGPWKMLVELARLRFPWSQTAIYQVDERIAPAGDADRNLTHMEECLPASGLDRVRPMPVEDDDLDAAADAYARLLPDRFDLIHLGLGPDGHTASLVPGDPVLDVEDRDVAITGPYQDRRRMTITYPVINRARALLWVVTGADKPDALRSLREGDQAIPAGRITSAGKAWLLADVAASTGSESA